MHIVNATILNQASASWHDACHRLGVRIDAPFTLGSDGSLIDCIAFLPDFGGPKGMVVGAMDLPKIKPNALVLQLAHKDGLYASFINATPYACATIKDSLYQEALSDWGFFGPENKRPVWLHEKMKKNEPTRQQ
jgi:hypothetical protein